MATALVKALRDAMWEGLTQMTPPTLCYMDNSTLSGLCVTMETKNIIALKAAVLIESFQSPL